MKKVETAVTRTQNALYCVSLDARWTNIAEQLTKNGIIPTFWMGPKENGILPQNCYFKSSWSLFHFEEITITADAVHAVEQLLQTPHYAMFLKILDRVDSYNAFSLSERDRLFKNKIYWAMNILCSKRIDIVIFGNVPHLPYDYALFMVCEYLSIPVLYSVPTFISKFVLIYSKVGKTVELLPSGASETPATLDHELLRFRSKDAQELQYISDQKRADKKLSAHLPAALAIPLRRWRRMAVDVVKHRRVPRSSQKIETIKQPQSPYYFRELGIAEEIREKHLSNHRKNLLRQEYTAACSAVNSSLRYVYVPLHYQPEATTAPLGGDFVDQIYMVEKLSTLLDPSISIVVKEHTSQFTYSTYGHQGRYSGYWSHLASIPKVRLVLPTLSSHGLMDASIAVATITGTAGWESVVRGRPSLVFGDAWYAASPGVLRVSRHTDSNDVAKHLDAPVDPMAVESYARSLSSVGYFEQGSREEDDSRSLVHHVISTSRNIKRKFA